jgi:hypothetical protein
MIHDRHELPHIGSFPAEINWNPTIVQFLPQFLYFSRFDLANKIRVNYANYPRFSVLMMLSAV